MKPINDFSVHLETVNRCLTRWESTGIVGLFDNEQWALPVLLAADDVAFRHSG